MNDSFKAIAERYLAQALNRPAGTFRAGQWECIAPLLHHKRVLVVQRTGWGKSMVYFLATRLLRDQGLGPAILISPLLSLMRNQIEAATRIGLVARTINSTNGDNWESICDEVLTGQVDILLISPERLANENFRQKILSKILPILSLFVIDEAHCISDWGHDFRPDYRRIIRILQALPNEVAVLATTATANDRVVKDVQQQMGSAITVQRGSLVRKSLSLQNITIPKMCDRMAWLVQTIPHLPGSGIVYTLTQRDAERLTEWLCLNQINAKAYHAGIDRYAVNTTTKESLEQALLSNKIKVLVATVALGMGFDKPDLGFVIHFQRPASVVHYYQQVGRAGRGVEHAYGILLSGEEDDRIADYFIQTAFPTQHYIDIVLGALRNAPDGLSIPEMQRKLNLSRGQLEKTIKYLTVEEPCPISKSKTRWLATPTAEYYTIDQAYVEAITKIRRAEQQQMRDYMVYNGCLMTFLQRALDDPNPSPCGRCYRCALETRLDPSVDPVLSNTAGLYLCHSYHPIQPRKQWPIKGTFTHYPFKSFKISDELQAATGRTLSMWRDEGWGNLVAQGRTLDNRFDDKLIGACAEMLHIWHPNPAPTWLTCVPSIRTPSLLEDFAQRLARVLNIPFVLCIKKIIDTPPQREMGNGFMRAKNLDGAFEINPKLVIQGPCLLLDDTIDTGWTMTVLAALLRKAQATTVYPLVLAYNPQSID